MLERASIDALVRELVATSVLQHVRVNGEAELGGHPEAGDHFAPPSNGER
jgi:hypothetical protein